MCSTLVMTETLPAWQLSDDGVELALAALTADEARELLLKQIEGDARRVQRR